MLWALVFGAVLATSVAVDLPGVPTEFATDNHVVLSAIADDIARKFEKEYVRYVETGVESAALRQISAQLASSHSKKDIFTTDLDKVSTADEMLVCVVCRSTVNVLARTVRDPDGELNGADNEVIAKSIVLDICRRLEMQTEEVCGGLFDFFWPSAEYIIRNSVIESRTFCSLFMQFSFCNVHDTAYNWTLNIDSNGPAITGPKTEIPHKGDSDLRILHVTDIHYDPLYEEGSLAECDEPVCCQRHKDVAEGTSQAAGYWGDYRECDLPWQTVENAFGHIKETHAQIDYIYQTGDVVDHMVWATSKEKNIEVLTRVSNKLSEDFPDVPVYPCIGNHEPHPLNLFSPEDAPDDINTNWLYEQLYEDWSKWLPASTKETILKGGYYTVTPRSGFRIISINSNFCYLDNYWLFYNGTDKIEQLEWLHDTLLAAEVAGEHVHILTHIPSGDGTCWSVWSREYSRLIERFSHIISGTFTGHSHKDEMNVYYSAGGHAIGLSWNGGSLTTYTYKNPNYRIYHVEPATMQVVDHETWLFNLTAANEHGSGVSPTWYREYVFSEEFTDNLSPGGIDSLLDLMAENPDLLWKFWQYKMTSADPRVQEGCGRNCLITTLCRLATTVNDQKDRCNELTAKLINTLENGGSATTTTTTTTSPPSSEGTTTDGAATTNPTEGTTPDDEGDGAASIVAMSLTSLLAFLLCVSYLF